MGKKRNNRPERKMKPVFLVFCEGQTEEAYVNLLRQKFRLPVKIIPHITGLNISPALIKKYIKFVQLDRNDTIATFLMYDLDTKGISVKLAACDDTINICSNPCIELWFLLHNIEQFAEISTAACISSLQKIRDWKNYSKGMFSLKHKEILWEKRSIACQRARALPEAGNPSSSVYKLIEAMQKINQ